MICFSTPFYPNLWGWFFKEKDDMKYMVVEKI